MRSEGCGMWAWGQWWRGGVAACVAGGLDPPGAHISGCVHVVHCFLVLARACGSSGYPAPASQIGGCYYVMEIRVDFA
eukprot:6727644-Prymnesium_polylepis.1